MVFLNVAHLSLGPFVGRPLFPASSAEWGGRLPPAHSLLHATQDLASICLVAGRSSKLSSMPLE